MVKTGTIAYIISDEEGKLHGIARHGKLYGVIYGIGRFYGVHHDIT